MNIYMNIFATVSAALALRQWRNEALSLRLRRDRALVAWHGHGRNSCRAGAAGPPSNKDGEIGT